MALRSRPEGASAGVMSPSPDGARDPLTGARDEEDALRSAKRAAGGRSSVPEEVWGQQVKEMGRRLERVERIVELVLESVRGRTASDGGPPTEPLAHHHSHSHHHHRGSRAESPSRADKWRNLAQDSLWKTHGPQKRNARGGRGTR
eukprot:Rhum_TRINITY_DN16020_c0_g1::Rhum_TRINITY_DN16020_c0_g1_i1::g.162649::m.162649